MSCAILSFLYVLKSKHRHSVQLAALIKKFKGIDDRNLHKIRENIVSLLEKSFLFIKKSDDRELFLELGLCVIHSLITMNKNKDKKLKLELYLYFLSYLGTNDLFKSDDNSEIVYLFDNYGLTDDKDKIVKYIKAKSFTIDETHIIYEFSQGDRCKIAFALAIFDLVRKENNVVRYLDDFLPSIRHINHLDEFEVTLKDYNSLLEKKFLKNTISYFFEVYSYYIDVSDAINKIRDFDGKVCKFIDGQEINYVKGTYNSMINNYLFQHGYSTSVVTYDIPTDININVFFEFFRYFVEKQLYVHDSNLCFFTYSLENVLIATDTFFDVIGDVGKNIIIPVRPYSCLCYLSADSIKSISENDDIVFYKTTIESLAYYNQNRNRSKLVITGELLSYDLYKKHNESFRESLSFEQDILFNNTNNIAIMVEGSEKIPNLQKYENVFSELSSSSHIFDMKYSKQSFKSQLEVLIKPAFNNFEYRSWYIINNILPVANYFKENIFIEVLNEISKDGSTEKDLRIYITLKIYEFCNSIKHKLALHLLEGLANPHSFSYPLISDNQLLKILKENSLYTSSITYAGIIISHLNIPFIYGKNIDKMISEYKGELEEIQMILSIKEETPKFRSFMEDFSVIFSSFTGKKCSKVDEDIAKLFVSSLSRNQIEEHSIPIKHINNDGTILLEDGQIIECRGGSGDSVCASVITQLSDETIIFSCEPSQHYLSPFFDIMLNHFNRDRLKIYSTYNSNHEKLYYIRVYDKSDIICFSEMISFTKRVMKHLFSSVLYLYNKEIIVELYKDKSEISGICYSYLDAPNIYPLTRENILAAASLFESGKARIAITYHEKFDLSLNFGEDYLFGKYNTVVLLVTKQLQLKSEKITINTDCNYYTSGNIRVPKSTYQSENLTVKCSCYNPVLSTFPLIVYKEQDAYPKSLCLNCTKSDINRTLLNYIDNKGFSMQIAIKSALKPNSPSLFDHKTIIPLGQYIWLLRSENFNIHNYIYLFVLYSLNTSKILTHCPHHPGTYFLKSATNIKCSKCLHTYCNKCKNWHSGTCENRDPYNTVTHKIRNTDF